MSATATINNGDTANIVLIVISFVSLGLLLIGRSRPRKKR